MRKDANSPQGGKRFVAFVGGVFVVATIGGLAYHFASPSDAAAQAPVRRGTVPQRGTQRPTTQRPTTQRPTTQRPTTQRPGAPPHRTASPTGPSRPAPVVSNQPAGPQTSIVAEVNNERITRRELGNQCVTRFGDKVLESIINRQVIWQACQRRNLEVSDDEVNAEIGTIAKRFGMDTNTWVTMLKRERDINLQQYRSEIIWPTLALRKLAKAQLVVTGEEIDNALEAEFGEKVRARIISVSTFKKAEELHAKAKADPNTFGELAKEHSEDPNSASARGLIPPIRHHVGDPKVEAAAFSLAEGEVSDIIHVANQYIIMKCDKRVPQQFLTPEQLGAAKERAREQLRDQRLRAEAAKIFQTLQAEAKVVTIFGDANLERQHPGVAAMINGRPLTLEQLADECILRYGDETLDLEINRRLLAQALKRQGKAVSKQDVQMEINRAADAYGYLKPDGSPDVQKWLATVSEDDQKRVDIYVNDAVWPSAALKKLVTGKIQITDADMKEGYEASFGERVEVLAIMLNSRRDAQKVWDMARKNPSEEFFGELASQYSIEPVSKANFGKVPPIRRHSGQKNLEEEAFRLKPGELSQLISVRNNFIILRCLGRTRPMVTIDEVKDELNKDIHEKKLRLAMNQTFERLKEAARIRRFMSPSAPVQANSGRTVIPTAATGQSGGASTGRAPVRRLPTRR